MAKKTKLPEITDYDELNLTELRQLAEIKMDAFLPITSSRDQLVGFLRDGVEMPSNPMDDVRIHQMSVILDHYNSFKPQFPTKLPTGGVCVGCCYDHNDMQVVECQVQTPLFRHQRYPNETK